MGGAELLIKRLAEGLADRGDDVVVVRTGSGPDWLEESFNGVRVVSVPARNIYQPFTGEHGPVKTALWHVADDWLANTPDIKRIIRAVAPDIIHTNTLSGLTANVWGVAAELSIPILHTLHDYYLVCPRCTMFRNGANCQTPCTDCALTTVQRRRLSQEVQAVVGVSQKILDIHLQFGLFPNALVKKVIYNSASAQSHSLPSQIGHPVRVGFIGRLSEEKGIFLLAEAMGRVPSSLASLVVAGAGSVEIQERVRRLAPNANITFMGFVRPAEFYSAVDLVVAPALWEEPGAMIIGEARSFGRPVLAGNVGAATELLRPGVDGWIVPLEVAALGEAITAIASDPPELQRMQREALLRSEGFSFGEVIEQYRSIYDQLCSEAVEVRLPLAPQSNGVAGR